MGDVGGELVFEEEDPFGWAVYPLDMSPFFFEEMSSCGWCW